MKKLLITAALAALPMAANAQYYDNYNNGNRYSVNKGTYGGSHVSGYNTNTGSTWNTNTNSNGNMNGRDADGNFWNYNASTGNYTNSNGTFCSGRGSLRHCN